MFAVNHAATALLLRKKYLTQMPLLLLAVQLPGLIWVALNYAGIEHVSVSGGTVDYGSTQYSSSLLSVAGMAVVAWLALRGLGRRSLCMVFAVGVVSYALLDLVMRGDIPVAPFIDGPKVGLGLYGAPVLAMAVEAGYGIFCWRAFNGRRALLATVVLFNLINLPLIFHLKIPFLTPAFEQHPLAFVSLVLAEIIISSYLVAYFSKRPLSTMSPDDIKRAVAESYGKVAKAPFLNHPFPVGRGFAESVGYPAAVLDRLPRGMWESFTGAGNPHVYADVKPGEMLLDMGCGAGLDLFIYSSRVGPSGKVYGLDFSGTMIKKARANLKNAGVTNFELIKAHSDKVPFPDNSLDVVTANGIYNLSPDKDAVLRETYRVLKGGGRTVFAEVMLSRPLVDAVWSLDEYFRCIGGALPYEEFLEKMRSHGFKNPRVLFSGKNRRTKHELAISCVISATK